MVLAEDFYSYNGSIVISLCGIQQQVLPNRYPTYSHVTWMYDFLYGFWYDTSADDYLVILIAMYRYGSTDCKTHIEIFSFKTNSWNQIQGFKFPYWTTKFDQAGLLLNGALHWLVFSRDTEDHVIIAFDLKQMSLLEIPIPLDDIDMELKSISRQYYLRVLGDCLCLCYPGQYIWDVAAEIWIMKYYKVQSSWTKSFVLPVNYDIQYAPPNMKDASDQIKDY
ncbi:F-box protein CPR1-like [Lotus japonicus]|uniref:F-box protein CPR1-like n=1 Tax=Lotus japonicus TaxID=34305 RepID=UPI0025877F2F|nr:F-box protein CPR1-like [Lotus japonicus]